MAILETPMRRTIRRVEVRVDGEVIRHDFGRDVSEEYARERLMQMVECLTPAPLWDSIERLRAAFRSPAADAEVG